MRTKIDPWRVRGSLPGTPDAEQASCGWAAGRLSLEPWGGRVRRSLVVCAVALLSIIVMSAAGLRSSVAAPSFACSADAATRQAEKLIAGFNTHDEHQIRQLIRRPAPDRDGLELAPTFADFAKGPAAAYNSQLAVTSPGSLRAFVRAIRGYKFELVATRGAVGTDLQEGPDAWAGPAVAMVVWWRAMPTARTSDTHKWVSGAAKTLVACPTGRFARALFSPNARGSVPRGLPTNQ